MSRNRRFPRSYRQRGVQTLLKRHRLRKGLHDWLTGYIRSDSITRECFIVKEESDGQQGIVSGRFPGAA